MLIMPIVLIIMAIICIFYLGYCLCEIKSLKKAQDVLSVIDARIQDTDFKNDFECGYVKGLIDVVNLMEDAYSCYLPIEKEITK